MQMHKLKTFSRLGFGRSSTPYLWYVNLILEGLLKGYQVCTGGRNLAVL